MEYKHLNQPHAVTLSKQINFCIKIICIWEILANFTTADEIMNAMSIILLNNCKWLLLQSPILIQTSSVEQEMQAGYVFSSI